MSKQFTNCLTEDDNHYVMFPIKYQRVCMKNRNFVLAKKIDLSKNLKHWEKLSSDEQHLLK